MLQSKLLLGALMLVVLYPQVKHDHDGTFLERLSRFGFMGNGMPITSVS